MLVFILYIFGIYIFNMNHPKYFYDSFIFFSMIFS